MAMGASLDCRKGDSLPLLSTVSPPGSNKGSDEFTLDHAIPARHTFAFENYGDAGSVDLKLLAAFPKGGVGPVGSYRF